MKSFSGSPGFSELAAPEPEAEGRLLDLEALLDKPEEVVVPDYYSSSYFESDNEA